MPKTSHVDNLSDFLTLCESDRYVFRGQTTDYGGKLIPSLFRRTSALLNHANLARATAELYLDAYKAYDTRASTGASDDDDDDDDFLSFSRLRALADVPGSGFGGDEFDEYGIAQLHFTGDASVPHYAVLQHYGAPSPVLDISFNPKIALWFATHEYRSHGNVIARYFRRTAPGVVYLMKVPTDATIDLRGGVRMPPYGLRGQRQEGCL